MLHGKITMENGAVIPFELYDDLAVNTVKNFVELIEKEYYHGKTFHRCIKGFVSQGGCPKGNGTGDLGYHIPLEIVPGLKHEEGTMAMARAMNPDSACCQFYICHQPQPHLDGQYAIFGKVTDNMGAVRQMRNGDRMVSITLED